MYFPLPKLNPVPPKLKVHKRKNWFAHAHTYIVKVPHFNKSYLSLSIILSPSLLNNEHVNLSDESRRGEEIGGGGL